MTLSLRRRILLTLTPLLLLLALLGAAGVVLLYHIGGRIDLILRENYDSVRAMFRLNEALERIDSSFQFAIAGQEADARQAYADNWPRYDEQLRVEQNNITLPGEAELVDRLVELTRRYRQQGDQFYARPAGAAERARDYFGRDPPGLLSLFRQIKEVSGEILRINQDNMKEASQDAQATAHASLVGFGGGLLAAALSAAWLAWRLTRVILRPIAAVTDAAVAVGAGQLHLTLPVVGGDELGRLAEAFNRMTGQLRDVRQSDAARLLRAQRTAQATIDSFSDPVLVVDPGGRVELANPAARQTFGVAPAADADGPAPPWQPPEPLRQPLAVALRERRAVLTESFDQAVTFRLQGEDHAYLPQIRPIRDPYDQTLGAAVVLNDVTRFRLLDQLKSDLVATVSHELKTPLTGVRLALHLLLEETVGPLTPKQTDLLLDARDNAERLLRMIEQLLALARLQEGEKAVQLRPESAADLLRSAADAFRSRAEDRHVELVVGEVDNLPPVAADAARLGQALHNLLDNALGYTEHGGRITLSAAAAGDGRVRLTVSDTGVGIPPEALPQVFERFFRVPGQSKPQGTGLGLAIVREIVHAHGGEVACESQPGQGTSFHITLPVWRGES
jgi:signal transduction histidine kinase/HAMP domain-containing protein